MVPRPVVSWAQTTNRWYNMFTYYWFSLKSFNWHKEKLNHCLEDLLVHILAYGTIMKWIKMVWSKTLTYIIHNNQCPKSWPQLQLACANRKRTWSWILQTWNWSNSDWTSEYQPQACAQEAPSKLAGLPSCQKVVCLQPCDPWEHGHIWYITKCLIASTTRTFILDESLHPDLLLERYWPILSWLFHNKRWRASTLPSLIKDRLWLTESLGGESDAMSKKNLWWTEERRHWTYIRPPSGFVILMKSCRT